MRRSEECQALVKDELIDPFRSFREIGSSWKIVCRLALQFQIVIARPYSERPLERQTPNSRTHDQTNRMGSRNCFRSYPYVLIRPALQIFKEIENQPLATEQIPASQPFNLVPRPFEFLKRHCESIAERRFVSVDRSKRDPFRAKGLSRPLTDHRSPLTVHFREAGACSSVG